MAIFYVFIEYLEPECAAGHTEQIDVFEEIDFDA